MAGQLEEILPAAYSSRVDALFVRPDTEVRGRFDPANLNVRLTPDDPEATDLLDLAAAHTFLNGGAVYVNEETLPEPGLAQAVAILRYQCPGRLAAFVEALKKRGSRWAGSRHSQQPRLRQCSAA